MTTPHLWIPFSASLLAALVTTIGIYVIRHFEGWGRRNSTYFSCLRWGPDNRVLYGNPGSHGDGAP
jgi:hypothetical protein